jgi:hypothetical protein
MRAPAPAWIWRGEREKLKRGGLLIGFNAGTQVLQGQISNRAGLEDNGDSEMLPDIKIEGSP